MTSSDDFGSFVSHLECSRNGTTLPADRLSGLSPAGAPLLVRYDLERLRRHVDRERIVRRPPDLWMWRELLPTAPDRPSVTLGECMTPLLALDTAGRLLLKDESRLPTGSFKARGMATAVSMAREFGVSGLVVPTAGNAGAAAAAYGAAAGLPVAVVAPRDTPDLVLREAVFHGAQVRQVDGLIDACGTLARRLAEETGWHDLSTLAEPYRLEGKKTMGLELALQLDWRLPDVIYYPTGGGTGFIGMWKAFHELRELGWIDGDLPRMVAVQTRGCCPIRRALDAGAEDVDEAFTPVDTIVPGVRVPKPLGARLILSVVRRSGGHATVVSDDDALHERGRLARRAGVNICPEGGACMAAYRQDLEAGRVFGSEQAVVFNTASGLKSAMPEASAADSH